MKQVFVNKGRIITRDVPVKQVEAGFVKVATSYSCISMGTELASVASSGKSILDRIKEKPDLIKRGFKMLKEKGIGGTKTAMDNSFDTWIPLGYSASGVVTEVGEGVKGFYPGDKVACAGGNYATHSEEMIVPKNLVAKLPDSVSLRDASSVAIGCIAMQGIRRADVKLGEVVVVIGLGLIGQLTVQMLNAAGARVIAADVNQERILETKSIGVLHVVNSATENLVDVVNALTDGHGADSVIIAAAAHSSAPLKQAFNCCRKRGRVVLVGVVDLNIDREDIYQKELEFYMSTSYGPGRYDSSYEENGIDYPYHWVRFTENRNMQDYLRLIDEKKINLDYMFAEDVDINDAPAVYKALSEGQHRPLLQSFKYSKDREEVGKNTITLRNEPNINDKIKVAICGVGGFAKTFHLPNLSKIKDYKIYSIMTRDGGNAIKAASDYHAVKATTDFNEIINDPYVDVVVITTRHNLHFQYVVDALKAGKTVFVEKPLCMNSEELYAIEETLKITKGGLMVGYNRRFSPHARKIKEVLKNRVNPMIINYVMNAGYIEPDAWVHGKEGGGRIIGEGCHIIDLFNYFTDELPVSVSIESISPKTNNVGRIDNSVITIKYDGGSVATLTYCANGSHNYPKEFCQIFCDNNTYVLEDYKETRIFGTKNETYNTNISDKGHYCELVEFAKAIKSGRRFLISMESLLATSQITFIVDEALR